MDNIKEADIGLVAEKLNKLKENTSRMANKLTKYEDIDPDFEWKKEEESHDTLELHVEGFRKEQLRVQLNNHGSILVSGEHPPNELMKLNGTRFLKEFKLSKEHNFSAGITANLKHGILHVKVPKKRSISDGNPTNRPDRRKRTMIFSGAVILVGLGAYLWLSYKYSISLSKEHNSMNNQTMPRVLPLPI